MTRKDIMFVDFNLKELYKVRNEHFCEDKQYVKKFWVRLNETNIIQLINSIEKFKKTNYSNKCNSSLECPFCSVPK